MRATAAQSSRALPTDPQGSMAAFNSCFEYAPAGSLSSSIACRTLQTSWASAAIVLKPSSQIATCAAVGSLPLTSAKGGLRSIEVGPSPSSGLASSASLSTGVGSGPSGIGMRVVTSRSRELSPSCARASVAATNRPTNAPMTKNFPPKRRTNFCLLTSACNDRITAPVSNCRLGGRPHGELTRYSPPSNRATVVAE